MDPFPTLPVLETPRLVLRQLTMDDAPDHFEFSGDPEVTQFFSYTTHTSVEDARQRIAQLLEQQARGERREWGVVLKDGGKLVGACGTFSESEKHRRVEIGYGFNRAYWNKGYATEAVQAVIRYCFTVRDLNRVEALCFSENAASARVMEKAGMSYEGLLRQYLFIKGEFKDTKLYSILRGDLQAG